MSKEPIVKEETRGLNGVVDDILDQANADIDGWLQVNDRSVSIRSLFDALFEQSKSDQTALKTANQRINNLHTLLGRLIERTP